MARADMGTKQRILEVARQVFAERGVKEATVREICRRAGANVAAVNYHFGGKDRLFMAVLADHMHTAQQRYPELLGLTPQAPARDRLLAYIRSLLHKFLGDGDPLHEKLGALLTAEFLSPSEHFDDLMDRFVTPQHQVLVGIVRELMPGASDRAAHLCAAGVVGYCLLFDQMRQVIRRMQPQLSLENLGVEPLAVFIGEFCLAGMERMRTLEA